MLDHRHPEYPTVKDVYELVRVTGEAHRASMQTLEEATNHKVDALRTQVFRVLAVFAIVSVPVVINNWGVLLKQIQSTVF